MARLPYLYVEAKQGIYHIREGWGGIVLPLHTWSNQVIIIPTHGHFNLLQVFDLVVTIDWFGNFSTWKKSVEGGLITE